MLDSARPAAHVVKERAKERRGARDHWHGEHVEHLPSLLHAMAGSRLIEA